MQANASALVVAVVLCAGQGTRVERPINKILLPIEGEPMFLYAVKTFERCDAVDEILLVAAASEQNQLTDLVQQAQCQKVRHIIVGGTTRHESERCALNFLRSRIDSGKIEIMLIHDGARPFIYLEKIKQLIVKAREVGGAILAVPLQEEEHIVQIDEMKRIQKSINANSIAWKAQTPQAFRAPLVLQAYDRAAREQFQGTDTSSVLERIGCRVDIVEGDSTNFKVTTAYDLFHAERFIRYHRS